MDEELGFDLQITGTQDAVRKLQPVINTIQKFSIEVNKLSKNLNNAISSLFNFSKQSIKMPKKSLLKQRNNYSKGYLELAKSGVLGDIGNFLLVDSDKIKVSILKQQKNLDRAYDIAGGTSLRRVKRFYKRNAGQTFSLQQPEILYQSLDTSFINYALKNTSNEINNVDKNSKKASNNINRFNNSINNTAKSSKNLIRSLWNFGKVVYMARRAASMIAGLVKESGSWIENLNLFAVTFGDNYQETLDWALEFADRLGVANNEIVKMTGLFKQLSTSIGLADELGDNLSQTLTQLAYDFASFYNLADVTEASEKLQAGIFSG